MSDLVFQELITRFIEDVRYERAYSDATVVWYQARLTAFRKRVKIVDLEEVTPERIRGFFAAGRRDHGWSSDNALGYYKTLRVFLKWCVAKQFILSSPIQDYPRPRLEKKLPKRLSQQDAAALLQVTNSIRWSTPFERRRNGALMGVLLFAGLRAAETLRLLVTDVDIQNRVISVRQGKWAKDRLVPFDDRLSDLLVDYLDERTLRAPACPQLFVSVWGKRLYYEGLTRVIHRIRKESGIAFSAHRLRHTYASLMLEGGCDLFSLSRLLGHEQVSTTSIYLSVSMNHLRDKVSRHPLEIVRVR